MFCPACGHPLPDAAQFCPGCGTPALTLVPAPALFVDHRSSPGSAAHFMDWAEQRLVSTLGFKPADPAALKGSPGFFDRTFERKPSIKLGWAFVMMKSLKPGLTRTEVERMLNVQQEWMDRNAGVFHMWKRFGVFIYLAENPVPPDLAELLTQHNHIDKSFMAGAVSIPAFLDLSTGYVSLPDDAGWMGLIPIRTLLQSLRRDLIDPYRTLASRMP